MKFSSSTTIFITDIYALKWFRINITNSSINLYNIIIPKIFALENSEKYIFINAITLCFIKIHRINLVYGNLQIRNNFAIFFLLRILLLHFFKYLYAFNI